MDPIAAAIRELRKHFNESQEAFAARLNVSLRALASYENGERRPTLPGMIELMKAADAKHLTELGAVFQRMIEKELGHAILRFAPSKKVELAEGEEEDVHAVLAILRFRGKMYTELRAKLKELIEPAKAANRAKDYRAAVHGGLVQTIQKGLAAGLTDEQILSQIPKAETEVAKMLVENLRKLAQLSKGSH
jgi:transcriptional regulator with XRE-family HTH domain